MHNNKVSASQRRSIARGLRTSLLALAVTLGGCATTSSPVDPLENYNRAVHTFNDSLDRNVLKPVAETYRSYVPALLRTGVRNFFANLSDIWIGANNLFQAKVGDAMSDWVRVLMNTTFGIGGLYDVASDSGLEKHNEDFGQTLGWWGVPSGPYLVLPFFGPSTFRDAPALGVDIAASPSGRVAGLASDQVETAVRATMWTLNTVNQRADALEATGLLTQAAIDPYVFTRDAFLQRRLNLVYDGNPPRQRDSDARAPDEAGGELPGAVGVNESPRAKADESAVSLSPESALTTQPGTREAVGAAGELGAALRTSPIIQ